MENVKTKIQFDGRRKEIHVTITEEKEFKEGEVEMGHGVLETKAVYNEEGIKMLVRNNQQDKTRLEQEIKRMKDELGEEPTEQDLKDLEEHNETQKKLKKIGTYKNNKKDLEQKQENLKTVNKALNDIKEEIGTRLKL